MTVWLASSRRLRAVRADAPTEPDETFREWVKPHLPAMLGLARRLTGGDADDCVQDALIEAWRTRDRFDASRGTARNWLLTLTANATSRHRRRSLRHPVELRDVDPEVAATNADADLDLRRAITALSPRQQLAVNLHYYLDLPVAEVAEVMRCSPGTVKSTLADARAKLRRHLEES